MDLILLIDLIGAIGFQINDTWTTYLGIHSGAVEANRLFKFLTQGKVIDFVFVGIIKVLLAVFLYACTLLNSAYRLNLELDFYLELAVTMWNIVTIYRHKTGR
jgi:hypothetical protein